MVNRRGKKGPAWTPEEEALLRRYMAEGKTHAEMGRLIGRSLGAVSGKINNVRMADRLGPAAPFGQRFEFPPFRENDDARHIEQILEQRPAGFPVAFSRPHFRLRAA